MEADPGLMRELRKAGYLVAMAVVWGAMCIAIPFPFGAILAFLGFLIIGASYQAGPYRDKK
jgi:hypothetical protein